MKRMFAALLMLMLLSTGLAENAVLELSGLLGQDIATAAESIGGLTRSTSDEYAVSYSDERLALRGNGDKVTFIELKPEGGSKSDCALWGITIGMPREDVEALFIDLPTMWTFDEETAYLIKADGVDAMFVLFYSAAGKVSGAWYRVEG